MYKNQNKESLVLVERKFTIPLLKNESLSSINYFVDFGTINYNINHREYY